MKATSRTPKTKQRSFYAVDVVPVRKLKRPVTLKEIKTDGRFDDFLRADVALVGDAGADSAVEGHRDDV